MTFSSTDNIPLKVLKFLQNLLALLVSVVSAVFIVSGYKVICSSWTASGSYLQYWELSRVHIYTLVLIFPCLWESPRWIGCLSQPFGERQPVLVPEYRDGELDICPPCYIHWSIAGLSSHSHVNSCGGVYIGKYRVGSGYVPDFVPALHGEGCFLLILLAVEES